MPRGRKKRSTPEVTDETASESVTSAATAVIKAPQQESPQPEAPPFEPTGTYTPTADEQEAAIQKARSRFRSWATDSSRGYRHADQS